MEGRFYFFLMFVCDRSCFLFPLLVELHRCCCCCCYGALHADDEGKELGGDANAGAHHACVDHPLLCQDEVLLRMEGEKVTRTLFITTYEHEIPSE